MEIRTENLYVDIRAHHSQWSLSYKELTVIMEKAPVSSYDNLHRQPTYQAPISCRGLLTDSFFAPLMTFWLSNLSH